MERKLTKAQARARKRKGGNTPGPTGNKQCVYNKYPQLREK